MTIGWYTSAWESAVSPYTIFGPLALVVSFSLLVEGMGDWKRHKNDATTNQAKCIVLHRISHNDTDEEESLETKEQEQQEEEEVLRFSTKERKELQKQGMDVSEHIYNQQRRRTGTGHIAHSSMKLAAASSSPTTTNTAAASSEMKKKAEQVARKFRKGISIHRAFEIHQGKDVVVPLLPSILEEEDYQSLVQNQQQQQQRRQKQQSTTIPSAGPNAYSRICFQQVQRANIRQGQVVLVKNREMIPADLILVASSADHGSAYIETSSIDGETNLKLRTRPVVPQAILDQMQQWEQLEQQLQQQQDDNSSRIMEDDEEDFQDDSQDTHNNHQIPSSNSSSSSTADLAKRETLEQAVKRVTRMSALGNSRGVSMHENAVYKETAVADSQSRRSSGGSSSFLHKWHHPSASSMPESSSLRHDHFLAALTSEPPNPFVHTFSGKLTLPTASPFPRKNNHNRLTETTAETMTIIETPFVDVPLGAENMLLRGAVLRNTEWVLGLVVFTGTDTKIVRNSFETPSKLSQLDTVINWTVLSILIILIIINSILAALFVRDHTGDVDQLWYLGYHRLQQQQQQPFDTTAGGDGNATVSWPYLPDLPPPEWRTSPSSWIQMFFLFLTLLVGYLVSTQYTAGGGGI